jgi:hypothetical protein
MTMRKQNYQNTSRSKLEVYVAVQLGVSAVALELGYLNSFER